jgi:fucose permease
MDTHIPPARRSVSQAIDKSAASSRHTLADLGQFTLAAENDGLVEAIEMVHRLPTMKPSETDVAPQESAPTFTTKAQNQKAIIQFAAVCWNMFLVGWNDGTAGPLIPRLQVVYHVGHESA